VTHPDVMRYLMSTSEAAQLILQAGATGEAGIFVLDMGKPLRILDVAKGVIGLHGFQPGRDIPIQFIGLRPRRLSENRNFENHTTLCSILSEHSMLHVVVKIFKFKLLDSLLGRSSTRS
jgi:FlaA1/EpsC-like NDP-sugar epimerase